ncbi:MAG TPA: glycosyltransferase [Bacteroidia bacterium]|nr:glycosyltransferase [Bacteroidia bacterium]
MKVLVYAQGFGGRTLTFIYNEVTALSKYCEVLVVCNKRGDAEQEAFPNVAVIPWHRNKIMEKFRWQLWQHDLYFDESNKQFADAFNEVVNTFRPDVIHCHFGNEAIRVTDNFKRTDIPVIVTFHGYDATQFDTKNTYRKKLRTTFSRPNIYPMFVSKYIRGRVEKMGVPARKGFLLYLGIDLDKFTRTSRPDKEHGVQFVQVSSFTPQKGHAVTVEAIRRFILKHPGKSVKFIFGGAGGTELNAIESLVARYGLQDRITFTGKLNPSEVRDLLQRSNYFLHHSITGPFGETEGLPTAIMEAMAMELPILTTWHAGIPELVDDGVNGFLVKEGAIDAYVEKMEALLNWDFLPVNREKIVEMCELNIHTKRLMEIYRKVASKN